jgi:hypothetical protein
MPVIEEQSLELPALVSATLAICAGAMGLAALAGRRKVLAETTLLPAWWWAVAAVLAWTATECAVAWYGPKPGPWVAPLRLASVAFSFCPVLAVLGAKRPQHAAWSFVVLAFWGILALPAAETFFLQRGQRLEMGAARSWFLWILILVGPVNYLPTRQWPAALLLAAAQVLALSEYLPLIQRTFFSGQFLVALSISCLAPAVARAPNARNVANPYDRLWFDFRDTFGLFWSLRLQDRVNSVAATSNWPLVLGWSGLANRTTGEPLAAIEAPIESTLRTTIKGLLRRFVSGDWIAARMGSDID